MIYLAIFLLLLWFVYLYDYRKERRGYALSFYTLLLIFIIVAGIRYRVGGDTTIYMRFFDNLHPINELKASDLEKSRFAPGFIIFMSFLKSIVNDYLFFQIIHSIIVNTVVFYFLKKNCTHVFFAIFLFFNFLYLYLLFEQVREALAVVIFLLAWPFFRKGVWWKWYIASFCAMFFHVSAVVMLFLPLVTLPIVRNLFIFGNKTVVYCLVAYVVAFLIQTTLFRYIEAIALTESMLDRAQTYGNMNLRETFNLNRIFGNVIQFVAYPLLALYFLFQQKKKGEYLVDQSLLNRESMMVMMSVYISIFSTFIGIFVRYNNYFLFFSIMVLGDWIFTKIRMARNTVRLGYLTWIFLFLPLIGVNFYTTYMQSVNRSGTKKAYMMYYPYSSYIDPVKDQNREETIIYVRRHLH